MAYLALYREWRPRAFGEVAGQEHVVRTLQNALKSGRLSHAYLFCGPRGTGKTSVARILAKAANCLRSEGGEPCGRCDVCREIDTGISMDVTEIDAASNRGIDEVRELREKVRFAPSSVKVRVFIVDEVHMLTNEAFNALLKTLEEPPAHAMFILATTEPHRLPPTILSRCQRFDFHRIGDMKMLEHLEMVAEKAGIAIDRAALKLIVKAAEGGVRDGLSILDQAAAYGGSAIGADEIHGILGTVREDLLDRAARGIMDGRPGDVLELVGEVAGLGKDVRVFLKDLNARLRSILLDWTVRPDPRGNEVDRLSLVMHLLARTEQEMRWSTQPQVLLEVAVVRAARVMGAGAGREVEGHLAELAARVRELEAMISRLAPVSKYGGPGPAVRPAPVSSGLPETVKEGFGGIPPVTYPAGEGRDKAAYNVSEREDRDVSGVSKIIPAHNERAKAGEWSAAPEAALAGELDRAAPAPPANLPKPGLLLDKINSRWADIMEVAGKACPHAAVHLVQGRGWPLEMEGNTLTVAFPNSVSYAPLALGILDNEDSRRELSEVIKSVCQVDLRLRLVISERKPPKKTRQQKKAVRSVDVDALFGRGGDVPLENMEGFESWEDNI